MKKNKGIAYTVLAITFVLLNVIAFAIPTPKTTTFWIAYAFTAVAFVLQIVLWNSAFNGAEALKSIFLGIPIISVGIIFLVVQIIAFAIFLALPLIPSWIAVIVCASILAISAICLFGTGFAKGEINRVEAKVEKKVFYIKSLQVDVEMLANTEADADIKVSLTKLAEKIRFSDPMSNDALIDIETEIADKIKELKTTENKTEIIADIEFLLTERNKKAKLLK